MHLTDALQRRVAQVTGKNDGYVALVDNSGSIKILTARNNMKFGFLGRTRTVLFEATSAEAASKGLDTAAAASGGQVAVKSITATADGKVAVAIELPDQAADVAKQQIATTPGVTVQPGAAVGIKLQFQNLVGTPITSLNFGSVPVAQTVKLGAKLCNIGSESAPNLSVILEQASVGLGQSPAFGESLTNAISAVLNTLPAGACLNFSVDFTPPTTGFFTANLLVTTGRNGASAALALSGTGV